MLREGLIAATLALAGTAWGQTSITLTGPPLSRPGRPITLSLGLSGGTANGPAGIQWTLVPPPGWTVASVATTGMALTAAKETACNAVKLLCLEWGMNTNVIANGQVATIDVSIPASALGSSQIALTGLVLPDKNGAYMPVSSGPVYSILITRADVNDDGRIDAADVMAMISQALGESACVNDQTADGKCDLVDVVAILKAMGL